MKWADGDGQVEAETPAGVFVVWLDYGKWSAQWYPHGCADGYVRIGDYRTAGAAKGACKRYAKRMTAAFKAMGKAGWQ